MRSVVEKGTVFPVKLKLEEAFLNKDIKKENFKRYLMDLIEQNHHINITSDHSASSNNSYKSHLNAKSLFQCLLQK